MNKINNNQSNKMMILQKLLIPKNHSLIKKMEYNKMLWLKQNPPLLWTKFKYLNLLNKITITKWKKKRAKLFNKIIKAKKEVFFQLMKKMKKKKQSKNLYLFLQQEDLKDFQRSWAEVLIKLYIEVLIMIPEGK